MTKANEQSKPRRGRPRKEDVALIDRGVLDAARRCFVTSGYDATTMESVAAEAGVTKTTLYLRYDDKEALLRAVLEDRLKTWGDASSQTDWMMGDSIEERLRYFARTLIHFSREDEIRSFMQLLNSLSGSNRILGQEYKDMLFQPMLGIISEEISSATGTDVPKRNADEAAAIFLGMLSGIAFMGSSDKMTPEDDNRFADKVTTIFLRGREGW